MLNIVFNFRVAFSHLMISYDNGANFLFNLCVSEASKAVARISGEFSGWRLTEKPQNDRLDNLASTFTVAFRFIYSRDALFLRLLQR